MKIKSLFLLSLVMLISGCNTVVMNSSGYVAQQESRLLIVATCLMLLIIVPVIFLTVFFAWKYRQSNTEATYTPDWDHSTTLEFVIWGVPLLIIIVLGAVTWVGTHLLDPSRPLDNISSNQSAKNTKKMTVEVVALDWKWLFIYPELNIATVNYLAVPENVPINFQITASTVMNSFFIPAMAGQIYAMPGMQTQLNAVMNKTGEFDGLSSNYSGAGFSDMHFKFVSMKQENFSQWVSAMKKNQESLNSSSYVDLEKPSVKVPVKYYGNLEKGLFDKIVNMCVECDKTGMVNKNEVSHIIHMNNMVNMGHMNHE